MLSFFSFLLFFFIALFLGGVVIVLFIVKSVASRLGGNRRNRSSSAQSATGGWQQSGPSGRHTATGERTRPQRKKIFGDDEGEYVDFEEMKDNGQERASR